MERQIIHMDQDAFFVSVEVRKDPRLAGKPVIIGGTSDRGVVSSCSYEARKFGVHSAMSSRMAKMLCPHAVFIKGNMDEYSKASHEITDILKERVPLIEKASIDEHYIDMTGMDRFHNTRLYAHELRGKVIKETGLPISFGLSVNKTVSKMCTNECKPNGELNIGQPEVRNFLNPLSIKKIPGLGEKTFLKLSDMGIKKIYTLSQMHPDQMNTVLGKNGLVLLQKAKGIDLSPVIPFHEQKSIGTQSTFRADTIDVDSINHLLTSMVMGIAYELRQKRKLAACVTVTVRYSNFEDVTKQAVIPYTSLDSVLIRKAKELFRQVYQKRMLIRLVGVRLSNLVSGFEQIDLYSDSTEQYSLCQAMDKIRQRFGENAISLASTMDISL
ncbi:DNA polymerase-4 [Arcticibacter tournemirensis]|uniref:DNA polymerase IV n=1 Tax=Arcticibacter tournemirensis TaxID=699437 RepID=A0A5M9H267_9SPHI|nr:DNA polymerase IV [Arcticibacter tournemirensis]KAA8480101.1 DNA polymerase IV [Arcticibacter tournemirensis]TQM50705.1 DNA polymerase-4 [Arcticibacter tournemirensis]